MHDTCDPYSKHSESHYAAVPGLGLLRSQNYVHANISEIKVNKESINSAVETEVYEFRTSPLP